MRAGSAAALRRVDELVTIIRAIVTGLAVSWIGVVLWGGIGPFPGLAGFNLRFAPQVPWAVVPMGLFLVAYLRYLNGAGWPRSTSAVRRRSLRLNSLPPDVWPMALLAGFIGLSALVPLSAILARLFPFLPTRSRRRFPRRCRR